MACEPTDLEALETLKLAGNKHFAAGRHAEALRHYTAALELPPAAASGLLLSNRSAAHLALCDVASAQADAEGAVAARPAWARAWQRLGRAAWAARDAARARPLSAAPPARAAQRWQQTSRRQLAQCLRRPFWRSA